MMVPRPTSAEELVTRSDIIAVGTIMSVLEEARIQLPEHVEVVEVVKVERLAAPA